MDKELWLNLREEIGFLKKCQINYFMFSIAAAGAAAGFGETAALRDRGAVTFLSPLLVVLPCSLIFFDKATTISRIVGFLRIVERLLRDPMSGKGQGLTYGWELPLKEYRWVEAQESVAEKSANYLAGAGHGLWSLLMFTTSHKYWVINWYTFTVLSIVSLILAGTDKSPAFHPVWWIALAGSVLVAFHNLTVLGRLTKGSYSHDACSSRWERALERLLLPEVGSSEKGSPTENAMATGAHIV